ncbi:ankyrin repeat-containing domain protein [Truncatella angustata]|uniref:Ankyrin repeat-containing domain protein n=1 Tax=Truncatella angustata TaxID=152316 RepID=A0A9P9A056_9PEZI|nr:ankyrin repeat-containing domain protein [Truncatella angustata]KAH6657977.1 ankyrin repeat-containing domain protein [Truncatella angustata]
MSPVGATAFSDTQLLTQEFEKRGRKREKNRIAQRTYRLNQKKRIQALETAAKQTSGAASPREPPASATSRMERFVISTHHRSDSMLTLDSSDVSNSAGTSNIPGEEALPRPEPWPVVPGLDPYHVSAEVPKWSDLAGLSPNKTPLQIAIQNKNVSLVQLLLREGADAARQYHDGSTALHFAVESGQEDIVRAILNKAVNPNEPDYRGRTALFRAIEAGDHAVARLLLDSASDPNLKDILGNTALHLAVEANSEILTILLLEYGAHIDP